ncbi:MAG TPA: hypothetical protein VJV75_11825, partial [Candidatus Polarisedimenticolia bacterium]|nr:hypothetical protein [Candidatus Polarisedimenticolia bacterium]
DRVRGKVVLFGGNLTNGGDETWEWDGARWTKIDSAITEGRFNAVMTWDAARGRVVRYGGWNGKERTADTWLYDGRTWEPVPVSGAPARNHAAMVYDAARGRAVMFGGHEGTLVFGDLWEWDGRAWIRRLATPPQERVENGH